jgi:hypothetical protein
MIPDNQMGKFSEHSYSLYQSLPHKCRDSVEDDVSGAMCELLTAKRFACLAAMVPRYSYQGKPNSPYNSM